jgi:hypothetical protein
MTNAEAFQSELRSDESLLWTGQSERRAIFHKEDILGIPLSLTWGGLAFLWVIMELGLLGFSNSSQDRKVPWFLGLPIVLISQYMIWGRFIYYDQKKLRTFYAVTNKRILRCNVKRSGKNIETLNLPNISAVYKSIRFNGIGTLEFDYSQTLQSGLARFFLGHKKNNISWFYDPSDRYGTLAFVDIADAENVYNLFMKAKEKLEVGNAEPELRAFS